MPYVMGGAAVVVRLHKVLLFFFLLFNKSCATAPIDIRLEPASNIRVGMDHREIKSRFGQPKHWGIISSSSIVPGRDFDLDVSCMDMAIMRYAPWDAEVISGRGPLCWAYELSGDTYVFVQFDGLFVGRTFVGRLGLVSS